MDRRWRGDEVVIFFSIETRASFEVEKIKETPTLRGFSGIIFSAKLRIHTYSSSRDVLIVDYIQDLSEEGSYEG